MAQKKRKVKILPGRHRLTAVDLFCGAGGLTRGLEKSGIKVNLGIDIDPACEYPYSENNEAKFILKSVTETTGDELWKYFKKNDVRILAGCAPCQTFSTYYQKAKQSDTRWNLLLHFSRLIEEFSPEIITMENVPGLVSQNIFQQFLEVLQKHKYEVSYDVINCADYGVPQHRNRLVLLASKFGPIVLLSPKSFKRKRKTVRHAISKLQSLAAGEISENDPLHQSASLSNLNLKRIKASKPSGTWRDWNENLVADCHKKSTGKTYPSVYGRMSWDEPAPTITTQFFGFGNGRFGHPKQDRAISLREGAMLQSFPKSYKFIKKNEVVSKKTIGRLIGNAVPVKLGELIGKSIIKHMENQDG